jgi:hypothetical protein
VNKPFNFNLNKLFNTAAGKHETVAKQLIMVTPRSAVLCSLWLLVCRHQHIMAEIVLLLLLLLLTVQG